MKKRKTMIGTDIEEKIIKAIVKETSRQFLAALFQTFRDMDMSESRHELFLDRLEKNLRKIIKT
jgi:predicted RNA polymerase sigma factor